MQRVIVIGAGAVGGSIAGLLADSGVDVILVARGAHGQALQRDGLHLDLPDRRLHLRLPTVPEPDLVDFDDGDVAIIATKLQDARPALDDLYVAAGPELPVVCAQNGMLGEQWASTQFDTVVAMMVWLPAVHLDPGHVLLHGAPCPGVLDCGAHSPQDRRARHVAELLCDALTRAGFDARPRTDIEQWKRAKWLTNLGGAAQALVEGGWQDAARAALDEGVAVLEAAQLAHVPVDQLLARCAHVQQVPVQGLDRPGGSTWQSLARGRSLETAFINGPLVALGRAVGVPTPINQWLLSAAERGHGLHADDLPTQG